MFSNIGSGEIIVVILVLVFLHVCTCTYIDYNLL